MKPSSQCCQISARPVSSWGYWGYWGVLELLMGTGVTGGSEETSEYWGYWWLLGLLVHTGISGAYWGCLHAATLANSLHASYWVFFTQI